MDFEPYEAAYPPRQLPPGALVTRIGPSPTGKAHVGTALQAVINRALADGSGGAFLLRIEDTDRERFVEGAVEDLLAALDWLGIRPDESVACGGKYGPYVQSERLPIYQAAARRLVESGHAYYCFCTPERLESVRLAQQAAGKPTMYDRHCRNLGSEQVEARLASGEKAVVRLKVPDDTEIAFDDLVRGRIAFESQTIDDGVLLKSDGFPTYHLAVVVDDHLMRVSQIIRGEEWIPSTPKHVLLYQYFGWAMPRIAHTPILRDMSRRKLSKRSGDTSITGYRVQGYLPEGLRNFLTRIVWPHPEGKDVYDHAEFVRLFKPEDLPNTGPIVDPQLLDFINGQYLRRLSPEPLYTATVDYLQFLLDLDQDITFESYHPAAPIKHTLTRSELEAFYGAFSADPAYSERVLMLEPERYKRLSDIVLNTGFFFGALFRPVDPKLLAKPLGSAEQVEALLDEYLKLYQPDVPQAEWEQSVRDLAHQAGVKDGKLFMTLRIAITGREQTPPLFEVLTILGGDEVQRRLELAAAMPVSS